MQVFVIINIVVNADVNAKKLIDNGRSDKGFIWNLVIVNVNVINYVMLEGI